MDIAQLIPIIQTSRNLDPTLADILIALVEEQRRVQTVIDPTPFVESKVSKPKSTPPPDVQVFTVTYTGTNIILSWEAPSISFLLYEVRFGNSWETATRLFTTANLQAILDPIATGTTTYLIKAISPEGAYSINAASAIAVVSSIGAFVITPELINNFIILHWTTPISIFNIDHYIITRDGTIIDNNVKSTIYTRQEVAAGTYTYGITAVDIFGNQSAEITVTVAVSGPTDFEIQDSQTSSFSGTIVNGYVENNRLIVCVDTTTTYEDHFIDNSWDSPQEQIDAGFPYWIQPMETTASYEEVFDFGVIYQNIIVNISWLFETIVPSFNFGLSTTVSDDDITYSSPDTSPSFFVVSARYVKVHFDFTGSDNKAILAFYQFITTLLVKREVDGGDSAVFAADAAGTVVSFTKAFKFVESITVSVKQTATRFITYDFAGGVNPTTFKVKVWNSSGTRQDDTISWKARGVL